MQLRHAAVFAAVLCALAAAAFAQQPAVIYGDTLPERAFALVEAADSGYCLAGWTRSYGPGAPAFSNALVIRTEPSGTPMWSLVSVGANDEEAHSMVRTFDGGYCLAGWTRSYGVGVPNANIFVVRLGAGGAVQWGRVFGGPADDLVFSIAQTQDSGFVVCGHTSSFGPMPPPNIIVLKISKAGVAQWARVYWVNPHIGEDEAYSIIQTNDLGYAVAGRAKISNPINFDAFVMKLNAVGNVAWLDFVPGQLEEDQAFSVAQDVQGAVLAAGWTRSFGSNPPVFADFFVLKCAPNGVPISRRTYGWGNGDEMALDDRSLVATADGGCALCGPTTSIGPGVPNPNFVILKLNPLGAVQWTRWHPSAYEPGLGFDEPHPMIELSGGGYAIAGWTNSYPHLGMDDFHFLTLDGLGNREVCVDSEVPYLDSFSWDGGRVEDSLYELEVDSMVLVEESVGYHAICVPVGIRDERRGIPVRGRGTVLCRDNELDLLIEQDGSVDICLIGTDGRLVAVLLRGWARSGAYRVRLPASVGSGIYAARGRAAGSMMNIKVLKF